MRKVLTERWKRFVVSSLVTWLIILFVRFCQEYSQGIAGAVFWFDMTIDDWVVKNVPIGRSGLCWIYQQLLHHPIHLKAGNTQLSKNSFFSVLSQTKRMSVGKSESVNNVLEPESIVVPVKSMWSLSYFCYSKCKVAFILRALEGIISHFTGEIVSARLPISHHWCKQNSAIDLSEYLHCAKMMETWEALWHWGPVLYGPGLSWLTVAKQRIRKDEERGTGIIRNAVVRKSQSDSNKVAATGLLRYQELHG